MGTKCPDLEGMGLEKLLHYLLKANFSNDTNLIVGPYSLYINEIIRLVKNYFKRREGDFRLLNSAFKLREIVYENGTPRQSLLTDIVCAVLKKRLVKLCMVLFTAILKYIKGQMAKYIREKNVC